MIKKAALIGCTSLVMPMVAHADTALGLYLGAYSWQTDFSGELGTVGETTIDIDDDLGFSDTDSNSVWYVALEHGIPVLPNVRLQQTRLESKGSGNLDGVFDGIDFTGDVRSKADFSHTDATLYYEMLDNWVSLDLGVTTRAFDGEVTIRETGGNNKSRVALDVVVPMLYGKVQLDLPLTGLSLGVDGNFVGYSGNSIRDINAVLNYEIVYGAGLALGYRSFSLTLDDADNVDTELTFSGLYAAATYHF